MSAALHASPLKRSPLEEQYHQWSRQSSPVDSPQSDTIAPLKKKRVYKKRKSTNTIRREQKAALQQEVEELQSKLRELKLQVLAQQGDSVFKNQVVKSPLAFSSVENAILRESIQEQHLAMAQVRALLSGHTLHGMNGLRPMETRICLPSDRDDRARVLHALHGAKVREAKRFLCARCHGLKPMTPYFQEERYETEEGDFCVARFEVTPLCGVKGGTRAVYDAMLQASYNAEIIISETSGNITIREDDDQNDDSVAQMRLVSQTPHGALLETNTVHFTEFIQGDNDLDGCKGSYAVIAADFVDEDELYPYRPLERVRRDVTAAMMITSYVKPRNEEELDKSQEGELVVVLSRLLCTRVCHSDMALSKQAVQHLHDTSVRYASNFLNCLREILGLPSIFS